MESAGLTQLIATRCVRRDHLTVREPERVFAHLGAWAYCPAGRRAADHQFIPTGGIELRRLETGSSGPR